MNCSLRRRASVVTGRRRRTAAGLATVVIGATLVVVAAPVLHWVTDYGTDREALTTHPIAASFTAFTASDIPSSEPAAVSPAVVAEQPHRVETDRVPTRSFTTVGVRVPTDVTGPVLVRWQGTDGWSDWHELEIERDVGPDHRSAEAATAIAGTETEPIWVGKATAYQVNLPAPADVGSAGSSTDSSVLLVRADGGHLVAASEAPPAGADTLNQPPIHTRSEWGARAPTNSIDTSSSLKMAIVHHSDTGNDYGPGDVPGILRSIQAYHIDGRGWSDIAYNIVVDKFGGIWEGREGSIDRLSTGAHSLGFNTNTLGVMVIGNYQTAAPATASIAAVADVIAWKFANERVDPNSTVAYTSGGSLSIPEGETRTFPRIVGHRDVGATDCPGAFLYPRLDDIRRGVDDRYPTRSSPGGVVDTIVGGPASLFVGGWAIDPNVSDPIEVHVYIDGAGTNLGPAANPRPDLAALFSRSGGNHGFGRVFSGVTPGVHQVCVFAINTGPGSNTLMRCADAVVRTGSPTGVIDAATLSPDGLLQVSGWAIDPDTADPIPVHVSVDGAETDLGPTNVDRADLRTAFPLYGTRHGYSWTTQLSRANHTVCVTAIDTGPGDNASLGCRSLTAPTGSPTGSVDAAYGQPDGGYTVSGWALDPDVSAPIEVHIYIDGAGRNLGPTAVDRPDIAAVFPGYGPRHGFAATGAGLSAGKHQMCVFGINVAAGSNKLLTCRTITVPGGSPFGSVDRVSARSDHRVDVVGWTLDPDTVAPIETHVYIDGAGANLGTTPVVRPDLAAAFPAYGGRHGFSWTSPVLSSGAHSVCVFGINVGAGSNTLLSCRNVTT